MLPSNNIKSNHEIIRRMQNEAHKAATSILESLGVDSKNDKYSSIRYQLQFDIYQSLKKNLEIESEY